MPAHDPIALGLSLPLGSVVPFAGLLLSIAPLPLFAGIFATMIPALPILKARGAALGVVSPAHFFWATGALSSFLDNAPTYLAFFSLAQGVGGGQPVAGVSAPLLQAIGAGAVFIGANSYSRSSPSSPSYSFDVIS